MRWKSLALLGILAILPACGQESTPPRYRSAVQDLVDHKDGTVTTGNWSGYAVTGTAFTKAEASWIVPAVTCKSGTEYAVFWVGLDGYSSSTVEQTGTEAVCNGTTATYSAWYEFCCTEPIITIPSMKVEPGDIMSASVVYNTSTGKFTLRIIDETTGKKFSTSAAVAGAARSSAEWIAEAPSSGIILPLADYGTVLFGKDSTNIAGTNVATNSTTHGPIGKFSTIEQITMEKKGVVESVPSNLSSDGTSFSVSWTAQ